MDTELMSTAQKIKKIRGILSIPQVKLTSKGLTRPQISDLEHGKIELTEHMAMLIVRNALKIAKRQHIEFNLTAEWLKEDEIQQAVKLMKSNLNDIEFEYVRKQVKKIIENKDVNKNYLFTLYNLCVLHYKKHKDVNNMNKYLLEMYNIAPTDYQSIYSIKLLMNVFFTLKQYDNVITWSNIAIPIIKKSENKGILIKCICFNTALAYRYLKENDKCIKILEFLLKNYSFTAGEKIDIDLIKIDILQENRKYNLAENMLKEMYVQAKDINDKYRYALVCTELSKLYDNQNTPKAMVYINKVLNLKFDMNLEKQIKYSEILYLALSIYIKFENRGAKNIFDELISFATGIKNGNLQVKAINSMYTYYLKLNDIQGIKFLLKLLKTIKPNSPNVGIIYYKILTYIYENGDSTFECELINGLNVINDIEI